MIVTLHPFRQVHLCFQTKTTGTMKKNMGSTDKIIRIVLALAIAGAYFAELISGTVAIIGGVLALVFVATSFISFCPLYLPFGLSTLWSKDNK